jgi:hypothetical protein
MIARRLSASLVTLALCVVLGACASYEKPLAPELFPAQVAAAAKDPTPIVLAVTDRELRYRSARQSGHLMEVEVPIGRIVEAAGALALGAEFERVTDAAGAADPRALQLRVDGIAAEVGDRLVYFIPLGPFPLQRVDLSCRLAFKVQATGVHGAVHWSQSYDSGLEPVVLKKKGIVTVELPQDAVQRMLHEQAARLMRQAAADLRAWLEQERRRERVL